MGLSNDELLAIVFVVIGLIIIMIGVFCLVACYMLWDTLLRGYVISFVGFATYLNARASKAVSSSFSSTSELPHSETHRRSDLIGTFTALHEYPGVIPNNNSISERILNRYARYLSTHAMDTNATVFRVRSWLRNCEQNHNGRYGDPNCQPLDEDGRGYPLWLIDIEQRCVVSFQASLSYFALSYVWGQVETAKMERSNLVQLQQPGSLLGPHQSVELPRTIKDAMFLTGFLGHRYLWCDRLCLVQDDMLFKLPQIQQMAEIYARAYCTIIAFDNLDANSGLGGLPSLTGCSHRQVSTSHIERARWSSRAWTFQEELFSVRIIQLSSHTVRWQCSPLHRGKSTCGSNHNNSESIRILQFQSDIGISTLSSSMQVGGMLCPKHASFTYYANLVEEYSQRHVNEQHPEDIFHAFSSVQSFLKVSYPGAFIQGIPECLLVRCLLWGTFALSYKNFVDPSTGMRASSWSWIGWSAPIYYPRKPRSCEGLVSWYVSLEKDSRRYPVSVANGERRLRHCKVGVRSRSSRLPLNASSTGKQDMSLESQGFQHIIPLSADSRKRSTLEVKNLCSFLHGRVLMSRFRVHLQETKVTERAVSVLLCETSGNYAGVLCGGCDLSVEGQLINLIAISEGSVWAKQCCKRHRRPGLEPEEFVDPFVNKKCAYPPMEEERKQRLYEFYDALWVEFKDGVAYRKDIGRVHKNVWEREELGWVDVTLG